MDELITQGLQLMGLGMGVVFLFLGMLVGVITLVSRTIQSFETKSAATPDGESMDNGELVQVIEAAVKQYRAEHPRRKR